MTEWVVAKFDAWYAANQPTDDRGDDETPELVSCDEEEDEEMFGEVTEQKGRESGGESSGPGTPEQKPVGASVPSKVMLGDVACGGLDLDLGSVPARESATGTVANNCQSPFGGSRILSQQRSINSVLCGRPSAAFQINPLDSQPSTKSASRSLFPLDKLERRLSLGSSISSNSSSTTSTVSTGGKKKKVKRAPVKEECDEDDDEEEDDEPIKKKKKKIVKASAKLTGNLFFLFGNLILCK